MVSRGMKIVGAVTGLAVVVAGAYLAGARPDVRRTVSQINDDNITEALAEVRVDEDPQNANSTFMFWGASLGPECQPTDENDNPLEYIVNGQEIYCIHRAEAPEEQQLHDQYRVYDVTDVERL